MKPEFSKPFDYDSARSGAPYCGFHGEAVRVLLWDRKHPTHPIIAIEEDGDQEAVAFRRDGTASHRESLAVVGTLVMLPLGLIDGKPVFSGDEIMDCETLVNASATPGDHDFKYCSWPAPVPQYPVTRMDGLALAAIQAAAREDMASPCIAVANAAIARCFADGDAVLPKAHARVLSELAHVQRQLIEAKARNVADIDLLVVEGIAKGRAARDMAVAEAVRSDMIRTWADPGRVGARCDLESIIASVSA